MENISNALLNFFSIAVLAILLAKGRNERRTVDSTLFTALTGTTMLLLFTDSSTWVVGSGSSALMRMLNIAMTTVYYLLHPLVLAIWALYVDYLIFRSSERLKQVGRVLAGVVGLFAVFIIASPWLGFIFSIDAMNHYRRGSHFMLFFVGIYALLFYTFIVILINRVRIDRPMMKTLLFFAIPPSMAGIIQAFYFGLPLIWPSLSLSILMVYINIQNVMIATDHLTGIYNRRQFESILKRRLNNRQGTFALIMLDVDDFKTINDTYGHNEGDVALESVARILRDSVRSLDVIARYAGDEFLVLIDSGSEEGLERAVSRINAQCDTVNNSHLKPYRISFSMGYALFRTVDSKSPAQVIDRVDGLMYAAKRAKKAGSLPQMS